MIRTMLLATTLLAALPLCNASAQTYKFKLIKDGKGMQTSMHDINDGGTSVGGVFAALGDVRNCIILNGKKITTISDPKGVNGTECWGISKSGTIVGDYVDKNDIYDGYIYTGGKFTEITPPKSVYTVVYGVNSSNVAIGYYLDADGNSYGFLFDGTKYTKLTVKGGTGVEGFGINDAGDYTIEATLSDGNVHSYLVSGKTSMELVFPNMTAVAAHHLNNNGQVSATTTDADSVDHGGVYDGTTGTYYTIDYPKKAADTIADGINDKLTIAGRITNDAGDSYAYIATGKL